MWISVKKKCGVFIMADHGYIDGKHVDEFFRHIVKKLGMTVSRIFVSVQYMCNITNCASGENI